MQGSTNQFNAPCREFAHALIFTGHMIDAPGREQARFPAWAESRARRAIHEAIAHLPWTHPGPTVGLAGAASGGDLLFHECCDELRISTRILLALPPDEFIAASVAPAGSDWIRRFHNAVDARRAHSLYVMKNQDGLSEGATDNMWQRANVWMIEQATALAPERGLLALWDGKSGDGPGGTEHFLQVARSSGVRVLPPISMKTLTQNLDH
jgi:hypothetical protein